MEVSKMPPADAAPVRSTGTAASSERGSQAAAEVAPPWELADIRPLDIAGALQILLAEVRAELDPTMENLSARSPRAAPGAAPVNPANQSLTSANPFQAARSLVEMFLKTVPDAAGDPAVWSAAVVRLEMSFQSGIERAIGVVSQWRDVAPPVVDAVKQTQVLIVAALGDDIQNLLWLRPEWMGLSADVRRFRRRRRNARRSLTDPDHAVWNLDDEGGELR